MRRVGRIHIYFSEHQMYYLKYPSLVNLPTNYHDNRNTCGRRISNKIY